MRFWPIFVLALIVALGAGLRISPLNDRDYWYDEAFTGITIRQPWPEMMAIAVSDVHPPMYYWLLSGWATVLGDGPMDLRAFSVALGIATIVLTYVVLRKWEPKSYVPGVIGALVVAINPFLVNYSQEARMYALLTFTLLLAAYCSTTKRRVAYSIAILLILLTHYLGALFVLCLFAWDAARHRWTLSWLLKGYLIPLIGGLFWLPSFLKQFSQTSGLGWIPEFGLSRIPITLATFLFGAPVGVAGVPPMLGFASGWLHNEYVIGLSLMTVAAIIVAVSARQRWDANLGLVALLAFAPPLLTLALQLVHLQLYVERYLIGSGLFLMLFCVMALYRLGASWLVSLAMIYTLLVALVQPWTYTADFQNLDTSTLPPTVVFTSSFDFTVGRYYVGENVQTQLYNVDNVYENFDAWRLIAGYQTYQLPTTDYVIITATPEAFSNSHQIIDQSGNLFVLKPL